MDLTKDRWPIVCKLANDDPLGCEGANKFGACIVFTNDGAKAKRRIGCSYKGFRAPIDTMEKAKIRVGQQKQSKRKVKTGVVEA